MHPASGTVVDHAPNQVALRLRKHTGERRALMRLRSAVEDAHEFCNRIEGALRRNLGSAVISIHVGPERKAKHGGAVVLQPIIRLPAIIRAASDHIPALWLRQHHASIMDEQGA
jgi:hypothetical protein